jgi:ribonuclease HII
MVVVRQTGNIKKNSFEKNAWHQGGLLVGLDEVGRGCFAGPVVAAAVILPLHKTHQMLKDSKAMTACEREKAFVWIKKHCLYGIGVVHHRTIDEKNIWQATLIAMKKALMHVLQVNAISPCMIVTDAMPLDLSDTFFHAVPVHYFTQGESRSSSIAAASIVAKVVRDAMMKEYDQAIPGYKLADNKGYGTLTHRKTISEQHCSVIHRLSFVDNFLPSDPLGTTQKQQNDLQLDMFF